MPHRPTLNATLGPHPIKAVSSSICFLTSTSVSQILKRPIIEVSSTASMQEYDTGPADSTVTLRLFFVLTTPQTDIFPVAVFASHSVTVFHARSLFLLYRGRGQMYSRTCFDLVISSTRSLQRSPRPIPSTWIPKAGAICGCLQAKCGVSNTGTQCPKLRLALRLAFASAFISIQSLGV